MKLTMTKDFWSNTININIAIDMEKNEAMWLESPGICMQDVAKITALARGVENHIRQVCHKIITNQEPYALHHIHEDGVNRDNCERCQSYNKARDKEVRDE